MQQTSTKGVQNSMQLGRKRDSLGIVSEIEIWLYYKIVQAEIRNRTWRLKFSGILKYKRIPQSRPDDQT